MIVINKKRILFVLSALLVSMFAFTLKVAQTNETVPTVALPISNKVIVIDAGHGKPDEGAQSSTRNH